MSNYDNLREDQIQHEITLVHNTTVHDLVREEEEVQIETAHEAADALITMAGFDNDDSDHFGATMGSVVHSALSIALMRCPQLAERLMGYADDVQIIPEML